MATAERDEAKLAAAIAGCLLGTAVGDSMGLPYEELSRQRQQRWFPHIDRQRLAFGKGSISDDTEHACLVAQSLIVSAGDAPAFARQLARRLQGWLLCLPAGVGSATLRSIVKLWLGFGWRRSGVFSAGNGPAMRSPILGVCYGDDLPKLKQLVQISTCMTHSDPKAERGALAIAIAAYQARQTQDPSFSLTPDRYYQALQRCFLSNKGDDDRQFLALIERTCHSAAAGESAVTFADDSLGLAKGISGYIYHTVPVVLQVWLRRPKNYRDAIAEIVALGGDTDTTAAILGALIGTTVGKAGIPADWLRDLVAYPRSLTWMETIAGHLAHVCAQGQPQVPIPLPVLPLLLRNLLFLIVVLLHGFRRLLPPY